MPGGDREDCVGRLVAAEQRYAEAAVIEARPVDVELRAIPAQPAGLVADLLAEAPEGRAGALGDRFYDAERRALSTGDDAVARLDDSRLLGRDLLHRVGQALLAADRAGRERPDAGGEHVGRIQPPAHPGLA